MAAASILFRSGIHAFLIPAPFIVALFERHPGMGVQGGMRGAWARRAGARSLRRIGSQGPVDSSSAFEKQAGEIPSGDGNERVEITKTGKDYSDSSNYVRAQVNEETGGAYANFVKGLKPNYVVVWRDIGSGFVALFLVLYVASLPDSAPLQLIAAILCAPLVGYAIAYLQLFIHEAAHYNLARNRRVNDFLCDLLISWQIGTRVSDYRQVHFAHHRNLGKTNDTENSYFNALTLRFVLEMLTGIHAVRVLLSRRKQNAGDTGNKRERRGAIQVLRESSTLLRGLLVYALAAGTLAYFEAWGPAAALALGVAIFFPFFAALRQLLEHRSGSADPLADYSSEPHGAVTRMFGDGPLASTFGGAGFNRHLLHHWEPQVSYTRLKDLEGFLMKTQAAPLLERRRTTYLMASLALLRNDTGLG